jgi:putative SOS response-associated peptidase YedK
MCNLYSITKNQQAIRDLADAMRDLTGNLPMLPGVFYSAPIVRTAVDGVRELAMARWGHAVADLRHRRQVSDPGITSIRNVKSPLAAMARRRVSLHRTLYQLR